MRTRWSRCRRRASAGSSRCLPRVEPYARPEPLREVDAVGVHLLEIHTGGSGGAVDEQTFHDHEALGGEADDGQDRPVARDSEVEADGPGDDGRWPRLENAGDFVAGEVHSLAIRPDALVQSRIDVRWERLALLGEPRGRNP